MRLPNQTLCKNLYEYDTCKYVLNQSKQFGQTNQILFAFTFMTHTLCNFGGKLGLYEQLFDILWLQKIGSRRLKVLIRTRDKVIHWRAIGPLFSKCIKIRILVIFSKPTCNLLGLLENGYCQSWLLKNVCNSPESY